MKCARIDCQEQALVSSVYCVAHDEDPSAVVLQMKRADEQNVEEAKKIRAEIEVTLKALAAQMDAAKTAGFIVSFNVDLDRGGRYYVSNLILARHY